MKNLFRLDAIVTFIDCKHAVEHLDEIKPDGVENEAIEQVAFADVLVINKTDLATREQIDALKVKLHSINGDAKLIESLHSRVPVKDVLNIRAFDLDRTLVNDSEFLNTDAEHMHDSSVSSVGICIEGDFIPDKFQDFLSTLLREKGADIYRSKGIISFLDSDDRIVFQGVHMMLNVSGSSDRSSGLTKWAKGEKRINKLCFIGRNLNRKELTEGVQACIFDGKFPDPGDPLLLHFDSRLARGSKLTRGLGRLG